MIKESFGSHQLLYRNQKPIDSGWVNKENLEKFASQIPGLDKQKFNACFNTQKYKSFLEQDIVLGSSFGFPSFKTIIEKKLAEIDK
jgi:hypothetical protein